MRFRTNIRHALLGLCAVCSFVCLQGCGCDYPIANAAKSPDGRYEAVLKEESCGAMSSLTYDITLYQLPRHDSRWPWMSSSRESILTAGYAPHLTLEWSGNAQLKISCPGCSEVEVYDHTESWQGIEVDNRSMLSASKNPK